MKHISPSKQIQLIKDFARDSKNRALKELIYKLLSVCSNGATHNTNYNTTMIITSNTGRAYRVIEDFRAEFHYTEKYDMIYEKAKPIIHFHFFSLYGNGSFEFYATDIESVEKIQTNTFKVNLNKRYKYGDSAFAEIVVGDDLEQEQEQEEQETTKAESAENTWFTIQFKEKTI